MPRWMRQFLSRNSLRWHFCVALGWAVVVRALCAYFVYGPQALDDYKHGVWPAYQHFAGQALDLPDYRSHLLVWILSAFIRVGSWFEVSTALTQVRVMYFGLAGLSLLGLVGTYLFVRSFRSRLFPPLALYLVAVYPLMPFVSTRAFGEAIAMSFVLLGFGVLEDARRTARSGLTRWCLGFLFLGVAVLFRFHVGLLFVSYAMILFYLRIMPGVMGAVFAGLLTLLLQTAVDVLSGKAPLGTLLSYLAANEGGAAQYGVSPWYNTWLFVLALTLPPFSFVFSNPHLAFMVGLQRHPRRFATKGEARPALRQWMPWAQDSRWPIPARENDHGTQWRPSYSSRSIQEQALCDPAG